MSTSVDSRDAGSRHRRAIERRVAGASWGVFFLWVGYALLAELSVGVGLLGVGLITLMGQAGRRIFMLPFEGFWVLAGIVFMAAGLWQVYALEVPLVPILLVGVGVLLVAGAVLGRGSGSDD
jgi:hypothetical protein